MEISKFSRRNFIATTGIAAAETRDGAMSIFIGIAARNSIESGKPVRISDLTDIELMAKRPDNKQG